MADRVQGGAYYRPTIHDGHLYLVGSGKLARAPLADIDSKSEWRFWNGTSCPNQIRLSYVSLAE